MARTIGRRAALAGLSVFALEAASFNNVLQRKNPPKLGAILTPGRTPTPVLPGVVAKRPAHARDFPAPPAAVEFGDVTNPWTSLGNDDAGDCVLACAAHLVQLASWHAKKTWITISDAEVLAAYTKLTGWTNTGTHDPGMDVKTGLNFAMQTGFSGHKLGGFYRSIYVPGDGRWGVDKHASKRLGIARLLCGFGGAVVTIDLPHNAYVNPDGPWRGADMDARIEGSHCIPIIGYDPSWIYCITWGEVVKMDWAFLTSTSRELYFAYAQDWLTQSGSADLQFSGPEMIDTLRYYEVSEYLTVVP